MGKRIDLVGGIGHTPGGPTALEGQKGTDGTKGGAGGYFYGLFGEKEGKVSAELNGGKGGDGQCGGTGEQMAPT